MQLLQDTNQKHEDAFHIFGGVFVVLRRSVKPDAPFIGPFDPADGCVSRDSIVRKVDTFLLAGGQPTERVDLGRHVNFFENKETQGV